MKLFIKVYASNLAGERRIKVFHAFKKSAKNLNIVFSKRGNKKGSSVKLAQNTLCPVF